LTLLKARAIQWARRPRGMGQASFFRTRRLLIQPLNYYRLLSLTRKLSKGSRSLKRLGQTYAIERRCSMTNLFNLTGKAALVTGGNGGIGLEIARGLAQAGARVAIIARNTDKSHAAAKALAEETGVAPLVLTADVSVPDQVAAVVNEAKNGL